MWLSLKGAGQEGLTPVHSPCTVTIGPLLEGRETRLAYGFSVTRFMLFEQSVADQKRDAAFAHFDRRNHGHAP